MHHGRCAWILRHFCLFALACVLCLGLGLFLGRMLLRRRMGPLAVETGRAVIAVIPSAPVSEDQADRLDLNTASVGELAALPGIGPVLAERLVEYRRTHGPYQFPDEIMNITGIDEKTYEALRDRITVG